MAVRPSISRTSVSSGSLGSVTSNPRPVYHTERDPRVYQDVPKSCFVTMLGYLCLLVELIVVFFKIVKSLIRRFGRFVFSRKERSCQDELVLVTGSGSGIGRFIAFEFAKRGAILVLWDINKESNEQTKREIELQVRKARVYTYKIDLSNREAIYKAASTVEDEVGSPDIIVNNAGVVYGRTLMDTPDHLIEHTFAVNILAYFWTVKAFLPAMLKRNRGHIVNIASMLGYIGATRVIDYCSSKFATVGFTDSLYSELQTLNVKGVRTTLVCPSLVDTGFFDGIRVRFPWLTPALHPSLVAKQVVKATLTDQEVVYLPKRFFWAIVLKTFLPADAWSCILDLIGVNRAMDTFIGRQIK